MGLTAGEPDSGPTAAEGCSGSVLWSVGVGGGEETAGGPGLAEDAEIAKRRIAACKGRGVRGGGGLAAELLHLRLASSPGWLGQRAQQRGRACVVARVRVRVCMQERL